VFYVFPITIPANTAETAKQRTTLKLTRGKITQIQVHFPSGHVGLTHITLNSGLYQFLPTNPEATFSSSGETISITEDFVLDSGAFELEAWTWNDDAIYDHTITVRVQLEALPEQKSLVDEIKSLLGIGQQEVSTA
jgi:hypothetical protein